MLIRTGAYMIPRIVHAYNNRAHTHTNKRSSTRGSGGPPREARVANKNILKDKPNNRRTSTRRGDEAPWGGGVARAGVCGTCDSQHTCSVDIF